MRHLGIRDRILLAALAPAILVAVLVTGVLVIGQWNNALESQHRRIAAMARQIAAIAEFNLFAGNVSGLNRQLELALREPDIVAAAFLSADGVIIASTIPPDSIPETDQIHAGFGIPEVGFGDSARWHAQPIRSTQTGELDLFATHEHDVPLLGQLLLQISTSSVQVQVRNYALQAVGISLAMLILGMLLALGLARGLIVTLGEISAVVDSIAKNRQRRRATHTGPDELGQLAQGVNAMADAVAQTQEDLIRRIREATLSLREERDAAAQAAESRSRFFAAASHDLRQPAQALGLFAARLERDARDSPLQPRILQLAHSVKNLQKMLDELLDYSRLSGGVYRTSLRPIRTVSLIDALVEEFEPAALEARLDLRRHVADCWLMTDPTLLNRILINLVSNALRYTKQGGVLVACRRGKTHARIEVWDTGIGIPLEQQSLVFEELMQLGNPERDPTKGLGLGLAIVRRTADLLCHPLSLHSRVGRGTCFRLTVPLAMTPVEPLPQPVATKEWLLTLGVDDETHAALAAWDLAVTPAADADRAHALIVNLGAPTLVLIDTRGDLRQSVALLDRLDRDAGQALPALLIHSGPIPDTDLGHAQRQLLSRPFRPARLRALVEHLLLGDDDAE